jgi:rod shape-determining protein MreD
MIGESRDISIVVVAVSVFLAYVLWLLPLPPAMITYRPLWILMVVGFWVIQQPERIAIGFAWFLGLLQDALSGGLLGEHALAMAVCAYALAKFQLRLWQAPMWYQTLFIFGLSLGYLGFIYLIQGAIGQLPSGYHYWIPAVTTALFWPWIQAMLKDWNRRFLR